MFPDGLAEAGGGVINQPANVRRYGAQATGNERQDRGRVVYIERGEFAIASRCDEEAQANGESEENCVDGTNALHACALPCSGERYLRRGGLGPDERRPDVNLNSLPLGPEDDDEAVVLEVSIEARWGPAVPRFPPPTLGRRVSPIETDFDLALLAVNRGQGR